MENKKKKQLGIFNSIIIAAILLLGSMFLFAGCNKSSTNEVLSTDYVSLFNHKFYSIESSNNDDLKTALSQLNKENVIENFYIMSEKIPSGTINMVSASKSKVISFVNQNNASSTNCSFSLSETTITLTSTMTITYGNAKYTASQILFLPKDNKMQITFNINDTDTTATAIFKKI